VAKNNNTGKRMLISTAIAGVVGYVVGILSAPQSGKETRADIADKAEDIKDETVEQLRDIQDELGDLLKIAKTQTLALSTQAREEFNEAVVHAKDAQNKANEVLRAVKKGEADHPELNKAIKQAKQAKKNLGKYLKS
jgi:gas vesicle protein